MRPHHRWLAWAVVAALGPGCAPVPKLTPETPELRHDAPVVVRGVEVRVLPNAWRGYPSWLTRSFTPMWLYFVNRGSDTFDVTYASLSLVDEDGNSFPAIPSTLVAREILGAADDPSRPRPIVSAQEPATPPDSPSPSPSPSQPRIPAPEPLPPASPPAPPLAGEGHPGSDIYYGLAPYEYAFPIGGSTAAVDSGRSPFGYEPASSPFGPVANSRNAQDIVAPALREGRLLPNTHAEGFVYFRANPSARRLELRLPFSSR